MRIEKVPPNKPGCTEPARHRSSRSVITVAGSVSRIVKANASREMDTIALSKFGQSEKEAAITFLVNGRDLIDIIVDHDGIALGLPLQVISQERQFTVFAERISPSPERLVVLACEQGWSGVTAATAMVHWAEGTVTWSELAPAWRGRRTKITQIGPFTFPRRQYEDVLEMGRRFSDDWRVHHERAPAGGTS